MTCDYSYLKSNVNDVMERVEKAALKSGRKLDDITVIAVSKTVDPERIMRVIDEGIIDLGENRVQELTEKYDIIKRECNWHLIGHLQTNKVKYIIDKVKMIHSVDSLDLAKEIQKRANNIGKVADILIQVNVANEETKFGIDSSQVVSLAKEISGFPNIHVKGLMVIAPYADDPEDVRGVFKEARKIFVDMRQENIDNINMDYLSMGMSNDFEVAIEEGSNIVRIGTALFGKRQY